MEGVFAPERMDRAVGDATAWGNEVLGQLDDKQRAWYLEGGVAMKQVLRKLDNPVSHRPFFRELAGDPVLLGMVERFLGHGVYVFFSQIFFKPPEGGGPKPVHQDNYYFGPDDNEGTVTAWIALDKATVENGCLFFGDGTNRGPIFPHIAPPGEPFNLQVPEHIANRQAMTAAPVEKGGVSFHHGNTFHQSSANRSANFRRAVAIHYASVGTKLIKPALPYDESLFVSF